MGGLSDLRVLELAGGVGAAYAAKLFADLGADVIRLERRDHDVVRARPHEVHRWLNTNKRSQWVDGDALERLLGDADLLIHDLGPCRCRAAGVDAGRAARAPPVAGRGLLHRPTASAAPGPTTPPTSSPSSTPPSMGFLSPGAATDLDQPPLKAPGHHATLLTATVAATAFLAAVDRARRSGVGDHVDFSAWRRRPA